MEKIKIELQHIRKTFPGVIANDDVSLKVQEGTIHAIVGENGAGKTTLMGILYGLVVPDSGKILIDSEPVSFRSPKDAIAKGIGMVHQHFVLIPKFTVTQNIILGNETGNRFLLDLKKNSKIIQELSTRFGLNVDVNAYIRDLSVTMQQRVEILKTLYRKAEIIIFDEPTAVLTPQEIDDFCEIALRLKSEGKTIIFISHKLPEVIRIADNITVIRRGKVISTISKSQTNEKELTRQMVGRDLATDIYHRTVINTHEPLLRAENISYRTKTGLTKLSQVSLTVYSGEILGIAGVDGNGQEELVEILCGKAQPDGGTITVCGKDITGKSVFDTRKNGVGIIYEDRQKDGLVLNFSVKDNLILGFQDNPAWCRHGFLNGKTITENAQKKQKTIRYSLWLRRLQRKDPLRWEPTENHIGTRDWS